MVQTNFEIKKSNTVKFFRALREKKILSRMELKELTGLSWGSVSAISNELLQKQLILAEKESVTTGRPPEKLTINPMAKLSLGIDINSVGLSFNVVNLAGDSVYSAFSPLQSHKKDDLLRLLEGEIQIILARFPTLIGINLSMQGKLNRKTGISVRTNFFKEWKDIPLVQFFEERFGIPTRLYHDPESLLTYHLNTDPRLGDAENGIVIRVDDGIGMAQLVNGRIYETGDETSCELGHTIAVPGGILCACGKLGCLESYSSLRGMRNAYYQSETPASKAHFPTFLIYRDERAEEIMQEACHYLGIAIANLFTLSAPSFILLDGLVTEQVPGFYEAVLENTAKYLHADCKLLKAHYRRDAAAVGACMLTIDKRLEEILFEDTLCPV